MTMTQVRKFEYSGRTVDGKLVKGKLEAPNESIVASRMRGMGLYPVAIEPVTATGLQREISLGGFGKGVKLKDLVGHEPATCNHDFRWAHAASRSHHPVGADRERDPRAHPR